VRAVLPVYSTPQALLAAFAEKATEFCAAHPDFHAFFSFTSAYNTAAGRRYFKVETGDTATPPASAPLLDLGREEKTGGTKRRIGQVLGSSTSVSSPAPAPAPPSLTNPNARTKRAAAAAASVDLDALQREIDSHLGSPVRPPVQLPSPPPTTMVPKLKTSTLKTCIWNEGTACAGGVVAFSMCRKHFQLVPVVQQHVHRALYELMAFSVFMLGSNRVSFCAGPQTSRNMALFKGPAPWTSTEVLLVSPAVKALVTLDWASYGFLAVPTPKGCMLQHSSAPGETWGGKTPTLEWEISTLPTKTLGGEAYGPVADVKRLDLEADTEQITARFGEDWHCNIEVDEPQAGFAHHVRTAPYAYTHTSRAPISQVLTNYFSQVRTAAVPIKSSFDGSYACLNSQPLLQKLQDDFNRTPYADATGIHLEFAAEPLFESDASETLILPTFAFCTLPAVSPHYLGTQHKDAPSRDRRTVVHLFTKTSTGPRLDAIALVRLVGLPACTSAKIPSRTPSSDEIKAADELRRFSAESLGGTETTMFLVDVLSSRPGTKAGKVLLQSLWKAVGARFTSAAKPVLMTLSFTNSELSKLYCSVDIEDGKTFVPTSLTSSAPFLVFYRTTHADPPEEVALRISGTAGLCKTNPCLPTAMEAWKQRVGGIVEAHETLKNALSTALKTPLTFVTEAGTAAGKAAAAVCALSDTLISTSSNRCEADMAAEYEAAIKRSIAASRAHIVSTLCASSPHVIESAFKSTDMWTAASTAFFAALPALKTVEAERFAKRKSLADIRALNHGLQARP